MRYTVNLLGGDNAKGLTQDIAIVTALLQASGCRVLLYGVPVFGALPRGIRRPIRMALRRLVRGGPAARLAKGRPRYDLNLHLSCLVPTWIGTARRNVLVPNPECVPAWQVPLLRDVEAVWVKSRAAEPLFSPHSRRVEYLGFTSLDRLDAAVPRAQDGWLHVAGGSTHKGTDVLIRLWAAHPRWPTLTLVTSRGASWTLPPNVERRRRLSDGALRRLQNACPMHLCPSRVEGFGHTIQEAMSCGACVVTTDAPPMNEWVTPEAGFLVRATTSESLELAPLWQVDEGSLEEAVSTAMALSAEGRERVGRAVRERWEDLRRDFRQRLDRLLEG
jgi:glycosyltransferase involved in cell wall biosynthesis